MPFWAWGCEEDCKVAASRLGPRNFYEAGSPCRTHLFPFCGGGPPLTTKGYPFHFLVRLGFRRSNYTSDLTACDTAYGTAVSSTLGFWVPVVQVQLRDEDSLHRKGRLLTRP